jgi:hypothetical protein
VGAYCVKSKIWLWHIAITFLFQTSLEQGKLPNDWLQAHIVPVFKKGDKNTASKVSILYVVWSCGFVRFNVSQQFIYPIFSDYDILHCRIR